MQFGLLYEIEVPRPLIVVAAGLVTAWALADAYRARVGSGVDLPAAIETDRFALVCVVVYLVVAAIVWIEALPSYLEARNGLTPGGDPIGWLPYSVGAGVLSVAIVATAYLGRAPARAAGRAPVRIEREATPA
jgi:hypothetical protein